MAVFIVTLLMFVIVVGVLLWVKTPRYQMTKADVITLLQRVLVGQASENDWAIFLSTSFRHCPPLEQIRDACALLDEKEYLGTGRGEFLFTESGLRQLSVILHEVEALDLEKDDQ